MSPMPSGNPRRNFSLRLFVAEMFSLCCCCSFSLLFATFVQRIAFIDGHRSQTKRPEAIGSTRHPHRCHNRMRCCVATES